MLLFVSVLEVLVARRGLLVSKEGSALTETCYWKIIPYENGKRFQGDMLECRVVARGVDDCRFFVYI